MRPLTQTYPFGCRRLHLKHLSTSSWTGWKHLHHDRQPSATCYTHGCSGHARYRHHHHHPYVVRSLMNSRNSLSLHLHSACAQTPQIPMRRNRQDHALFLPSRSCLPRAMMCFFIAFCDSLMFAYPLVDMTLIF